MQRTRSPSQFQTILIREIQLEEVPKAETFGEGLKTKERSFQRRRHDGDRELLVRLDKDIQKEALAANIYDAVHMSGLLVAGKARHVMCHHRSCNSPQAFTQ